MISIEALLTPTVWLILKSCQYHSLTNCKMLMWLFLRLIATSVFDVLISLSIQTVMLPQGMLFELDKCCIDDKLIPNVVFYGKPYKV